MPASLRANGRGNRGAPARGCNLTGPWACAPSAGCGATRRDGSANPSRLPTTPSASSASSAGGAVVIRGGGGGGGGATCAISEAGWSQHSATTVGLRRRGAREGTRNAASACEATAAQRAHYARESSAVLATPRGGRGRVVCAPASTCPPRPRPLARSRPELRLAPPLPLPPRLQAAPPASRRHSQPPPRACPRLRTAAAPCVRLRGAFPLTSDLRATTGGSQANSVARPPRDAEEERARVRGACAPAPARSADPRPLPRSAGPRRAASSRQWRQPLRRRTRSSRRRRGCFSWAAVRAPACQGAYARAAAAAAAECGRTRTRSPPRAARAASCDRKNPHVRCARRRW